MRIPAMPFVISRIILAFFCLSIFSECSQSSSDKALLGSLDQTLSQSTLKEHQQMQFKIESLNDQLQFACSRERAREWLPVAQRAEQLTQEAMDYFTEARKSAENRKATGRDLFDSGYVKLTLYREQILMLNERIKAEFMKSFDGFDPKTNSQSTLSQQLSLLREVGGQQLVVALTQLRYTIMQIGASVVSFCREQVGCFTDRFETYAAIIGQSSTGILPGQSLEIVAGMGAFSKPAQPIITINGKRCEIEDDGVARLSIAGSTIPGKYQTKVRIEYINQDGIKSWIDKTVEWEVISRR